MNYHEIDYETASKITRSNLYISIMGKIKKHEHTHNDLIKSLKFIKTNTVDIAPDYPSLEGEHNIYRHNHKFVINYEEVDRDLWNKYYATNFKFTGIELMDYEYMDVVIGGQLIVQYHNCLDALININNSIVSGNFLIKRDSINFLPLPDDILDIIYAMQQSYGIILPLLSFHETFIKICFNNTTKIETINWNSVKMQYDIYETNDKLFYTNDIDYNITCKCNVALIQPQIQHYDDFTGPINKIIIKYKDSYGPKYISLLFNNKYKLKLKCNIIDDLYIYEFEKNGYMDFSCISNVRLFDNEKNKIIIYEIDKIYYSSVNLLHICSGMAGLFKYQCHFDI